MGEATDDQLLRRLKVGDVDALGEVFDTYGGFCLALARNSTPNTHAAESAVLEVFVQLWREPPDETVRLASWLLNTTKTGLANL